MKRKCEPKVFVGPHEVAGFYANLVLGLRAIGVQADLVVYRAHQFRYQDNEAPFFVLRWINRCNNLRGKQARSLLVRVLFALPGELLRFVYFPYALSRYDVYIFGFGQSILPGNWDLPILRFFGKRVIAHLGHGSELRPPYIDGAYQSPDGQVHPTLETLAKLASRNAKRAELFEVNADLIIGAPFSTVHYTRKAQLNHYMIGIPYSGKTSQVPKVLSGVEGQSAVPSLNKVTRLLHCPSHPALKGTARVREIVSALRAKGHALEYREIIGRPNSEVIAAIQDCDIVIDQMYSDTPLSGFATESAWYGKAVVVGGYGFEILRNHVPQHMWPPSKTCHPDAVEQALEELIVDIDERDRVGKSLHDFVHTHWSAEEVARRFLTLIRGEEIPEDWWLHPEDVVYFYGIGQTEEQTRAKIQALVQAHGVQALGLSCKPVLEQACLAFARAGIGRA